MNAEMATLLLSQEKKVELTITQNNENKQPFVEVRRRGVLLPFFSGDLLSFTNVLGNANHKNDRNIPFKSVTKYRNKKG